MIIIFIPNNNLNERSYIIDILIGEFLGLDYRVENRSQKAESDWEIELENGNKLIIEDHFFNNFPKDLEYIRLNNIPSKVTFLKNEFIVENDIPVIYGTSKLNIENSKIICGIDIFASSFFMLTRWEEYINKNRDCHNRFPATESLAYKQGFLNRPVVNEYVEILWNILKYLGIEQKRKEKNFQLYLTHDVDIPLKYHNFKCGLLEIAGDVVKRKDVILASKNLWQKLKVHIKMEKDPYDTFDYLMDISEKVGVKSYFFFMGRGLTKFDNAYKSNDDFIKNIIKKIKKRGHHIGLHSTYNAYNQPEQFAKEKQELEINFDTKITFGREHYLRFEVPTTWQIWKDNGMEWDSTLSFADKEGFRCGVCYEYSVFNILTREKLNLREKPLIVMDGSFATYQLDIEPKEMEKKINYLIEKVKKYNGDFVFLWHNSSFNTTKWNKYQDLYERLLMRESP